MHDKITLGFSPCPNDTFIFDALIHGRIDTEGLEFEPVIADVEALNQRAAQGEIAVTKLSYAAFFHLTEQYRLLDSGSALGFNCGPILVAREPMEASRVIKSTVAIPGERTTANFLLQFAYPQATRRQVMVFSAIEDAVAQGEVDLGLLIHENRFTYAQKRLVKIADLGEIWESRTGMPIPLGGIVANRNLPEEQVQMINRVLRRSVEHAFAHPSDSMPWVRAHAQTMDEAVMRAHIALYVNAFSVELGERGREAVRYMFLKARENGIILNYNENIFIN